MNIYIGNLNEQTTPEGLRVFFKRMGRVRSVRIIRTAQEGKTATPYAVIEVEPFQESLPVENSVLRSFTSTSTTLTRFNNRPE